MSKQKAQGTRLEVRVRDWFRDRGFDAERIAEGGSLDEGDVRLDFYGNAWIVEAKARQSLSVQKTLKKAIDKAGNGNVVLWWKRLVPSQGRSRRKPMGGVAEVVILTPTALERLINDAYEAGKRG